MSHYKIEGTGRTKAEYITLPYANTAIGEFSGIGIAGLILKEVPTIIQTGTFNHPWLGISGGQVTPDMAPQSGMPINYRGVGVSSVQSDSPADS